jgi:hypothetical protein
MNLKICNRLRRERLNAYPSSYIDAYQSSRSEIRKFYHFKMSSFYFLAKGGLNWVIFIPQGRRPQRAGGGKMTQTNKIQLIM